MEEKTKIYRRNALRFVMFTFLLTVPLNTGAKCVGYLMFTVIQMINQRIFPGHASQIGTVTMLSRLSYSKHWVNKEYLHRKKKVREFPVPSRDVTTKLSLGGNNDVITELFLPRGSLVSDIPA